MQLYDRLNHNSSRNYLMSHPQKYYVMECVTTQKEIPSKIKRFVVIINHFVFKTIAVIVCIQLNWFVAIAVFVVVMFFVWWIEWHATYVSVLKCPKCINLLSCPSLVTREEKKWNKIMYTIRSKREWSDCRISCTTVYYRLRTRNQSVLRVIKDHFKPKMAKCEYLNNGWNLCQIDGAWLCDVLECVRESELVLFVVRFLINCKTIGHS